MSAPWNPTGTSFTVTRGSSSLIVTEVGATLRDLVLDGVRVAETFAEDGAPTSSQGAVLVPWPNRVRDGQWVLEGADGQRTVQQLDLTEPARHNASHGLLRTQAYTLSESDPSSITLSADIHPQRGYPFSLATSVRYALGDAGLTVTHTIANHGTTAAPVGVGTHGYYRIGDIDSDQLTLTSSGESLIEVDERMNPVRTVPVPAHKDLRQGRRVAELSLDDAYTRLHDSNDRVEHELAADDGRTVSVWAEAAFAWVQFYTSDRVRADGTRSIAIEPMTMPADAFNSGDGVAWVHPGETWTGCWGVTYRATQ
ncbi:aldose 1-epimerase family protein [Paramicrobacterium chengjingii]|uniref:Aldose 1-epimerase family protein n=1 Tax=Paramicrobacterium chengjingii TaxID=2769067 RepID=A0ABX6YG42_9MICO|nr:aldose 1-epimerase family protein [Microbacterium chengjingii]QPZ37411.1 aldose 1-epimerase family protein [Microbacterium chengjingii]